MEYFQRPPNGVQHARQFGGRHQVYEDTGGQRSFGDFCAEDAGLPFRRHGLRQVSGLWHDPAIVEEGGRESGAVFAVRACTLAAVAAGGRVVMIGAPIETARTDCLQAEMEERYGW